MLLKPAVALLMGNPFAGSANTLDAPSRPMPATSRVAIAMIRISFSPMSFTWRLDQTTTIHPSRRSDRPIVARGRRMLRVGPGCQAGTIFLPDRTPVHALFIRPVGDTDPAWANN